MSRSFLQLLYLLGGQSANMTLTNFSFTFSITLALLQSCSRIISLLKGKTFNTSNCKSLVRYIHPSFYLSIFYIIYPLRFVGKLEPFPAEFRWEMGYTLNRFPVYRRPNTEVNNQSHSHLWARVSIWPNLHIFGLLEKTRAAAGNPHRYKENMQTLHRNPQLARRFKPRNFWLWGESPYQHYVNQINLRIKEC